MCKMNHLLMLLEFVILIELEVMNDCITKLIEIAEEFENMSVVAL